MTSQDNAFEILVVFYALKMPPHISVANLYFKQHECYDRQHFSKGSALFLVVLHEDSKFFHCLAGDVMLDEAGILFSYPLVDAKDLA